VIARAPWAAIIVAASLVCIAPRHHPLVTLVLVFLAFIGAGVSMVMAFKSAEYADDYGLTWWWAPLCGLVALSLFCAYHGISLLICS